MTAPFRFKQFTVQQTKSAMKVGFDGILLGAWVNLDGCRRILDVGTGTGLVSLMCAQRSNSAVKIHGIDISAESAAEARNNFLAAPWRERLTSTHVAMQEFGLGDEQEFDLAVCNPPYFTGAASPRGEARTQARHSASLKPRDLIQHCRRLLCELGRLAVIVPVAMEAEYKSDASRIGWCVRRELRVRPLPQKPVHRVLFELGIPDGTTNEPEQLTIEKAHHSYTDEFKTLTRDFYLAF